MPNILMLAPTAKSFLNRNMHENPTFRSPKSLTCQYHAKRRLDYVEQLMERGYARVDAEAAWRIAKNGGMDLLTNLHQVELADETDRLETAINTQNTDGDST